MKRSAGMARVRRSVPVVLAVAAALGGPGCRPPEKPTRGGHGAYAIEIDGSLPAPTYHRPLDAWIAQHSVEITRGGRSGYQCALCHDAERHCIPCHNYLGLRAGPYLPAAPAVTVTAAPAAKPSGAAP